jgi:hypothetical protein
VQQCCGIGAARIRNFLPDPAPELGVLDPELDLSLKINHPNKFANYDVKNRDFL